MEDDVVEIPLGGRTYPDMVALVNRADRERLAGYAWRPKKDGNTFYAVATPPRSRVDGVRRTTTIRMHRFILGDVPDGLDVDHINRNGLDNRRSNLRVVTRSQNMANSIGLPEQRTSRFKGVHRSADCDRWEACIGFEGRSTRLGFFKDEIAAAKAYDRAAFKLFGSHALLNFPDEVSS